MVLRVCRSSALIMQTKLYKIANINIFDHLVTAIAVADHTRIIVHNSEFCNLGKILWMNIISRDFITSQAAAADGVIIVTRSG